MHCSSFDPVYVTHLTNIARIFSPIWSFRVCLCVCLSVCLFLQRKTARLLLQKKTYRKTDTQRRTWKQRLLNLFELKSFNLTQWRHHVVAKRDDVIVKSRQVTRDCETASPKPRSLLPSHTSQDLCDEMGIGIRLAGWRHTCVWINAGGTS